MRMMMRTVMMSRKGCMWQRRTTATRRTERIQNAFIFDYWYHNGSMSHPYSYKKERPSNATPKILARLITHPAH